MTLCNFALDIRNMTRHFEATFSSRYGLTNLAALFVLCLAALILPAGETVDVVRLRGPTRAVPQWQAPTSRKRLARFRPPVQERRQRWIAIKMTAIEFS